MDRTRAPEVPSRRRLFAPRADSPGDRVRAVSLARVPADALIIGAVVVWSLNVIVVKAALADSGPLMYAALRFALGSALLAAVAVVTLRGAWQWPGADLRRILVGGLLGVAVNQTTFTVALRFTSAIDVSLIVGSTPLWVAAWAVFRGREHLDARVWAGLLTGAVGLSIVVMAGEGQRGGSALWGDLLAMSAPASWGVYMGFVTDLLPRYPPLQLSALVTAAGTLPLLPLAGIELATSPPHPSWTLLGFLLFSSVLAVGYCTIAAYSSVKSIGATRTATYTYLQPFLGVVFAAALLGERLRLVQILGGVVVLVGIVVGRRGRTRPSRATEAVL